MARPRELDVVPGHDPLAVEDPVQVRRVDLRVVVEEALQAVLGRSGLWIGARGGRAARAFRLLRRSVAARRGGRMHARRASGARRGLASRALRICVRDAEETGVARARTERVVRLAQDRDSLWSIAQRISKSCCLRSRRPSAERRPAPHHNSAAGLRYIARETVEARYSPGRAARGDMCNAMSVRSLRDTERYLKHENTPQNVGPGTYDKARAHALTPGAGPTARALSLPSRGLGCAGRWLGLGRRSTRASQFCPLPFEL